MQIRPAPGILIEKRSILSRFLEREVEVDFYLPRDVADPSSMNLLLINDGQNMEEMNLAHLLDEVMELPGVSPVFCAAIHAGKERKSEYGVAAEADYRGRGDKAGLHHSFILNELLPYIRENFLVGKFQQKVIAGFSLGGLAAIDLAWTNPGSFDKVGVFSGSLWWRNLSQDDEEYDDNIHRIIHQQVRHGKLIPGLKFYFQCGNMDETRDRNENGIIDSIDDTLDLIKELENKGYQNGIDIKYVEMADGKHDIPTWGRAMPGFLQWAFTENP